MVDLFLSETKIRQNHGIRKHISERPRSAHFPSLNEYSHLHIRKIFSFNTKDIYMHNTHSTSLCTST